MKISWKNKVSNEVFRRTGLASMKGIYLLSEALGGQVMFTALTLADCLDRFSTLNCLWEPEIRDSLA